MKKKHVSDQLNGVFLIGQQLMVKKLFIQCFILILNQKKYLLFYTINSVIEVLIYSKAIKNR